MTLGSVGINVKADTEAYEAGLRRLLAFRCGWFPGYNMQVPPPEPDEPVIVEKPVQDGDWFFYPGVIQTEEKPNGEEDGPGRADQGLDR